jgi:hypothetical protein
LPSWQDREANRRGLLRELNERIAEVGAGLGLDGGKRLRFVCECGNGDCMEAIELTHSEYEAVRAHARRFAIAPDHENPTVESITGQTSRFAVAETFVGDASRIPEETDPRGHRELHEVTAVGTASSAG